MDEKGKIIEMQIIHKVPLKGLNLPKRWIVWAITKEVKKVKYYIPTNRVWLCAVTDDSDALPLRQKSLLVKNFFKPLIGKNIEFSEKWSEEWYQSCYGVDENTLPKLYQEINSFSDIHDWFQKNRPECLENDLEILRKERNRKIAATKKENTTIKKRVEKEEEKERRKEAKTRGLSKDATWEQIYEFDKKKEAEADRKRKQRDLEKHRKNALKLAFTKGRNPKHGNEQWEARDNDHLYILRREDKYEPSEGKIPVEEKFDLVLDRITLVQRI